MCLCYVSLGIEIVRICEIPSEPCLNRAELGPMPTWVVWMVAGVVSGEWPETGRGFGPCLVFLRMLNQGLLGWCRVGAGPIIQHHCEMFAIGCVLD